jgi:hypothetical protein
MHDSYDQKFGPRNTRESRILRSARAGGLFELAVSRAALRRAGAEVGRSDGSWVREGRARSAMLSKSLSAGAPGTQGEGPGSGVRPTAYSEASLSSLAALAARRRRSTARLSAPSAATCLAMRASRFRAVSALPARFSPT